MPTKLLILTVAAMLLATFVAGQLGVPDLSMPQQYVEDRANVINPTQEQALNGLLKDLEQKTGVQYIILTVETTGGVPIEEFSIELAHEKWQLGREDEDNGLLFTLAVKDRQYRWEVGYGLEGVITDAFVGQVGREVLVPYLRRGDYSTGVYEANLRVIERIAQDAGVTLTGMPRLSARPPLEEGRPPAQRNAPTCCVCPCCGFLILLLLFAGLFGGWGRRGFGGGWWLLALPLFLRGLGRRGYYGGPFGGGHGGFGGSFGGMRGGGFGGGGASGRW